MDVTYKTVGEVIADCFMSQPQITHDFVAFMLDVNTFNLEVIITLSEEVVDEEAKKSHFQTMYIAMWFCNLDGERIDFSDLAFEALLVLCYHLQTIVSWGTVAPVQIEDGITGIQMFRCLDISLHDVSSALHQPGNSTFFRALSGMSADFCNISEELLVSHQQKMKTVEDIELFLDPASGTA